MNPLAILLCITALEIFGATGVIKTEPQKPRSQTLEESFDPFAASKAQARSQLPLLEAAYRANPSNVQAGTKLASVYSQLRQVTDAVAILDILSQTVTNDIAALISMAHSYSQIGRQAKHQEIVARLIPLGDKILADSQSDSAQLSAALQIYQLAMNVPRMEECLNRHVKLSPTNPELWYDLGAILSYQSKTNSGINAVSNAVFHSNLRLRQNPQALNLRSMATTDGRFSALRGHPDFKKIFASEP